MERKSCFLFLFFVYFGFTAHQDNFTHFVPSQSVSGAKMGDPQEKPPDHPQAELGLFLEPTAVRW